MPLMLAFRRQRQAAICEFSQPRLHSKTTSQKTKQTTKQPTQLVLTAHFNHSLGLDFKAPWVPDSGESPWEEENS